jgi:hypothetical protein
MAIAPAHAMAELFRVTAVQPDTQDQIYYPIYQRLMITLTLQMLCMVQHTPPRTHAELDTFRQSFSIQANPLFAKVDKSKLYHSRLTEQLPRPASDYFKQTFYAQFLPGITEQGETSRWFTTIKTVQTDHDLLRQLLQALLVVYADVHLSNEQIDHVSAAFATQAIRVGGAELSSNLSRLIDFFDSYTQLYFEQLESHGARQGLTAHCTEHFYYVEMKDPNPNLQPVIRQVMHPAGLAKDNLEQLISVFVFPSKKEPPQRLQQTSHFYIVKNVVNDLLYKLQPIAHPLRDASIIMHSFCAHYFQEDFFRSKPVDLMKRILQKYSEAHPTKLKLYLDESDGYFMQRINAKTYQEIDAEALKYCNSYADERSALFDVTNFKDVWHELLTHYLEPEPPRPKRARSPSRSPSASRKRGGAKRHNKKTTKKKRRIRR